MHNGMKLKSTGPLVHNGGDLRVPRQTSLGKWTDKLETNVEKMIKIGGKNPKQQPE